MEDSQEPLRAADTPTPTLSEDAEDALLQSDISWRESHKAVRDSGKLARQWAAFAGCARGGCIAVTIILITEAFRASSGGPMFNIEDKNSVRAGVSVMVLIVAGSWSYIESCAARTAASADWFLYSRDLLSTPSFNISRDLSLNSFAAEIPPDSSLPIMKRQGKVGAPMAEWWPDFVAELVAYTVEVGLPEGVGHQGQSEVIREVSARMTQRGKVEPSRTQIQEAVNAVLRRMRAAGNVTTGNSG